MRVAWVSLKKCHLKRIFSNYYKFRTPETSDFRHILLAALKACSHLKDLESGKRIHNYIDEEEQDLWVSNTLISMYSKCGNMEGAMEVFNTMKQRDTVSWNALALGYVENGEAHRALNCLNEMQAQGCVPNVRSFVVFVRACSTMADGEALRRGREIHSVAVIDMFVANALIDMYANCGSVGEAYKVFERMPCRSVVTWTSMISGYAENGAGETGLVLFERMQEEGCVPDALTYVAALKACAGLAGDETATDVGGRLMKVGALGRGICIHTQAAECGWEGDMYVASSLVNMYTKCGSLSDACAVFDRMPRRDSVAWTSMMLGYAESGEGEAVLCLFERMIREGCEIDSFTVLAAVSGCIQLAKREKYQEVNGRLVRAASLERGRELHILAVERGVHTNAFVVNALVEMYFRCGDVSSARGALDTLPVAAWNASAVVAGYVENGEEKSALEWFLNLAEASDAIAFVGAAKACLTIAGKEDGNRMGGNLVRTESLECAMRLHRRAVSVGVDTDVVFVSSLVELYMRCGSVWDARCAFDRTVGHDVVSWTSLINGYAENLEGYLALEVYSHMRFCGYTPDAQTFVCVLKACGNLAALDTTKMVHADIHRSGVRVDCFLEASLVDVYGKSGSMTRAECSFDSFPGVDSTTWNTLLSGYSRVGDTCSVSRVFQHMRDEDVELTDVTYVCVLSACGHAGLVGEGRRCFLSIVKPSVEHYICMVDMYARANDVDAAVEMLENMPFEADVVVWRSVLAACVKWGNVCLARVAFDKIVGIDPTAKSAYALMGNIYGSRGMWDEKIKIELMRKQVE